MRIAVSFNSESKKRSRRCSHASRSAAICSSLSVSGRCRGTFRRTGPLRRPARPAAHLVQERSVGTTPATAPADELGRDGHSPSELEVVEAEHGRQVPVDGRLGSPSTGIAQEHHALAGRAEPGQEAPRVFETHHLPRHAPIREVLEEQLEVRRVRAYRVGRTFESDEVGEVGLDQLDRLEVAVDHGERPYAGPGCKHRLDAQARGRRDRHIKHMFAIEHHRATACKTSTTAVQITLSLTSKRGLDGARWSLRRHRGSRWR
jgi:ribosomal protein L13E